jgi:hypothetical protein
MSFRIKSLLSSKEKFPGATDGSQKLRGLNTVESTSFRLHQAKLRALEDFHILGGSSDRLSLSLNSVVAGRRGTSGHLG